jgi:hypothetical protein
MKIRTDYVSNSSSSSFILGNHELFNFFNITKQDILDALIEMYGGKECYEKASARYKSLDEEYPDRHNPSSDGNHGPFWIYDLSDEKDREEAIKVWGNLLDGWEATNCHRIDKDTIEFDGGYAKSSYNTLIRSLYEIFGVCEYELKDAAKDPTVEVKKFIRENVKDPKTGMYGHYEPLDKCILDTVKAARNECGIMTNLDAVKCQVARFFIHADDNELMTGTSQEYGKNDKWGKPGECKDWETECYTYDRICEIILNHLIEKGKVKPDDPEFLDMMRIDDKYLTEHDIEKGHVYDFCDGKNLTWRDLKKSSLTWNMHEG